MRVRVPPRAARRYESVTAQSDAGDTVQFVQVFDEKRGKMRAEDITGGITTDGYNAPRARFDDQVCFDFMKGRCTRGASCRYSHDPNASGWDPNFGRRGRSPSPRRHYDSRDRYDDRRRSPPRRCCAVSVLIALVA